MGLAYLASRPEDEPGLTAIEAVHDFGELSQGDVVSCEFQLVNHFHEPLSIRDVIRSCGCSRAECSADRMAPGEKLKINTEWHVGTNRGPSGVILTVVAAFPDGRTTATELRMTGKIIPDIEYLPARLEFGPTATTKQVVFFPGRLSEFTLKRVSCTHRAFDAELLPDGVHVNVTYHPQAGQQEFPQEAYLVVETSSDHEPTCRIPLTVADEGKTGS